MNVPQQVLSSSQNLFGATDRILDQIPLMVHRSEFVGFINEIDNVEDFFLGSYLIKDCNLSTIVIESNEEEYYLERKCGAYDLNEISKSSNFRAAIILSGNLTDQLTQDAKVIVTIYKQSNLFIEINNMDRDTDLIVGVHFPYTPDNITGEISVIYKRNLEEWDKFVNY